MNIIIELLEKEGYESRQIEAIVKGFVKETVVKNPEMLSTLTEAVVKNQMEELKTVKQKRFNLGLNFLSVQELFSTGKVESTEMQSFSGLLDNIPMEEACNKEIREQINNIEIKKKS